MAGRPYTMSEMKHIVDYLVEHNAYSETGGRKMWMDLANSRSVNRTWQSIKETFLKRILPDIHNPYYNLSVEQICSFRSRTNIAAKHPNKLDICTISIGSNNSENQRGKEQQVIKVEDNKGEDKCSKIQSRTRSSTETLVLENCYETTEQLQMVLESPKKKENQQKSLRDFITYSEPLTPMLQEVLHDFDSDDEPEMQIVEDSEDVPNCEAKNKPTSPETIRESQSYTKKTENIPTAEESDKQTSISKIKSLKLKKTQKGTWENKEPVNDVSSRVQEKDISNNDSEMILSGKDETTNQTTNKENGIQKSANPDSNTTNDTPLPNNQEELAERPQQNLTSTESSTSEFLEPRKKKKDKSKKRSRSQSSNERKKKKKEKHIENPGKREQTNDTETFNSHPQATSMQNNISTKNYQKSGNQNDQTIQTGDTVIPPNAVVEDSTAQGVEGTSQEAGPSGINNSSNTANVNACLKSVSLYEEQFSQSNYMDSDEDGCQNNPPANNPSEKDNQEETNIINHDDQSNSKEMNTSNQSKEANNHDANTDHVENLTTSIHSDHGNVILLKSHSDTSSDFEPPKKRTSSLIRAKKSRERALASVFGFVSGGVSREKKRTTPLNNSRLHVQRSRLASRNNTHVESGSSDDYTTASESEETPVASYKRNGHSRVHIKPSPYEILSHENSLFVVGRHKIYPLLLKENGSLHYATCHVGHDEEATNSYWKTRYLNERKKLAEEKIRADELARSLQIAKENQTAREPVSPILQVKTPLNIENKRKETINPEHKTEEKVKIKFTKNKEIELEGQWSNINPLLEKMVEIFKYNSEQGVTNSNQQTESNTIEDKPGTSQTNNQQQQTKQNECDKETSASSNSELSLPINTKKSPQKVVKAQRVKTNERKTDETVVISSGISTPVVTTVDPETRKKVDKIEGEIFQKIADIDKAENIQDSASNSINDVNVTKRKRGRPRKVTSESSTPTQDVSKKARASSVENTSKQAGLAVTSAKKTARASSVGGRVEPRGAVSDVESKRTTRPPTRYTSDVNLLVESRRPRSKSKLSLSKPEEARKESTPEDEQVRYKFPEKSRIPTRAAKRSYSVNESRLTSPDSSRLSDSTQGYHDSEVSPPKITFRRKKKMSTMNLVVKKGLVRRVKRKSCPYLADDDSCSTTESQSQQKANKMLNVSQTLNSDVYRSDSYQILMPKTRQQSHLDKIDENTSQTDIEPNNNMGNLTLTININNGLCVNTDYLPNSSGTKGSEVNSSNISLPLSPELSVVENLSISKDLINTSLDNIPTINETQCNDPELLTVENNKYLISDIDITMPLMAQQCDLQTGRNKPRNRRITLSESLQRAQYSTDSLDEKLKALLLESAKKIADARLEEVNTNNMEVDTMITSERKTRAKKRRSSTPRKKIPLIKSKRPKVGPVLEEHTESCSKTGRTSCPPVIKIIPCEEASVTIDSDRSNETANTAPVKGRKKKDVLKVKILRPRSVSRSKDKCLNSRLSVCTDSGIIESGSDGCQCCDISTELIHNHSDTCLHMNDCVGDSSVEIIESSTKSVISLNSNSFPSEILETVKISQDTNDQVTTEMFCSNARHATNLNSAIKPVSQVKSADDASVYHTPPSAGSYNSLITEDLSDEIRPPSKASWYLSDEDTNFVDAQAQVSSASVGSNLNKIFTSCAVPDLSTISEISKESDSKTLVLNTNTKPDRISPSIFDP